MKPTPYSTQDFQPWDYASDQRLQALEGAVHTLATCLTQALPSTQGELQQLNQRLEQSRDLGHELAAIRTLTGPSAHSAVRHFYSEVPFTQEIARYLHEVGVLPRVRYLPSPLALMPSAFTEFLSTVDDGAHVHEEPKEVKPFTQQLEDWYAEIVRRGWTQQHVQWVKNASIFHNNNAIESALLISVTSTTALVILPEEARWVFLTVHRRSASERTLVVSAYSGLAIDDDSLEWAVAQIHSWVQAAFLNRLPDNVRSFLDPQEREALETNLRSYVARVVESTPEMTVPVGGEVGLGQSCSVQRGQHDQLGTYTTVTLATGEIVFRDDVKDMAYLIRGTREKPELLEIPFMYLPAVSMRLLNEAFPQAIAAWHAPAVEESPEALDDVETTDNPE